MSTDEAPPGASASRGGRPVPDHDVPDHHAHDHDAPRPLESAHRAAASRDQDDPELHSAFERTVEEGETRLTRSWSQLLATGAVGGIDIGIGVLALLVVEAETGSRMLGALAFAIGFVALTLGRSELFTENFLIPVGAAVARNATVRQLLRLWVGTAFANLVAGWVITALIVVALPDLAETAVTVARYYPELGIGWEAFSLGILGGVAITVMTWMERGSASEFGKVIGAVAIGFLLAAGPLNHVIVVSLEMFAALHVGAPFGYLDWAGTAAWAGLANMVGGLVLVTGLRVVQIGASAIEAERRRPQRRPADERPGGDSADAR